MSMHHSNTSCLALALGLGLFSACSDDGPSTPTDTETGEDSSTGDSDDSSTGDGDGDGDGDDSSTGDGDPATGDGDGDDTTPACSFLWDQTQMKVNGQVHAAVDVAVAADGSFFAVGRVEQNDYEIWLAKFDAEGSPVWDQVLTANGNDFATGIALDEAGDLYITGSYAGNADNLWVAKHAGSDGAQLWSQTETSNFDGDNEPGDIALGNDGALFVSGTVRMGDDDTDIWLRELSPSDGTEIWATSYSGQTDMAGFSIDQAGSLSVAPDGTIYVGGTEGVNFETRDAILLSYSPEGGAEQWRFAPQVQADPHLHSVSAVLAGPDNEAYVAIYKNSGDWAFWLDRVASNGELDWELSEQDFVFGSTNYWTINGLELREDGLLSVAGNFRQEETGQGIDWSEVWVANLSREGEGQCIESHTWQNTHIIPASTYGYGFGEGPGGTIAVGEIRDGPENYLWVGGYK